MIDIILKFPKSTIYFFRFSRQYVNKAVYRHILCMVLAIILLRGHRTYANVSRLFMESRDKSCISRCFKNSVFPGFLMQQDLCKRLLKESLEIPSANNAAKPNAKRIAYIIIDGTAQKKQGKKIIHHHLQKGIHMRSLLRNGYNLLSRYRCKNPITKTSL